MVPFCGWEMPLQYKMSIIESHLHCRKSASLFDVSHMQQLRFVGLHEKQKTKIKPEQPKTQQQNGTQSASQPPSQASTTYAQSPNTSLNISRRPAELQSSLAQLGLTNSNPDTDDVQTDSTPVSRAKIDFQYVSNQKRSAEASKAKFTNLHFIPF